EIRALVLLVEQIHGKKWKKISTEFEVRRSDQACRKKYKEIKGINNRQIRRPRQTQQAFSFQQNNNGNGNDVFLFTPNDLPRPRKM
ncbi:14310_t:CDS:2, partial [Funneliformis caledonium]